MIDHDCELEGKLQRELTDLFTCIAGIQNRTYLFVCVYMCAQSWLTLCNPMDYSLLASSDRRIFPGKNTGVGCHFLLQGIFPPQHLLHWQSVHYATWEDPYILLVSSKKIMAEPNHLFISLSLSHLQHYSNDLVKNQALVF